MVCGLRESAVQLKIAAERKIKRRKKRAYEPYSEATLDELKRELLATQQQDGLGLAKAYNDPLFCASWRPALDSALPPLRYAVSNEGYVRDHKTGYILRRYEAGERLVTELWMDNGKIGLFDCAQLVVLAWVRPTQPWRVEHKDGDWRNCWLSNLVVVYEKED